MTEYMYVFKYPEQASRPQRPWYLRQTALYHQVRLRDRRSTFFLISPYDESRGQQAAIQWLRSMKSAAEVKARAFALHDVLLSCYLPGYRLCTSSLEEKVEDLVSTCSRRLLWTAIECEYRLATCSAWVSMTEHLSHRAT